MDNAENKYVCIEPRWYITLELRTAMRMSWDNMFSCVYHNLDLRRLQTSRHSNMNEEQKGLNELAQPESRRVLEIYQNLICR